MTHKVISFCLIKKKLDIWTLLPYRLGVRMNRETVIVCYACGSGWCSIERPTPRPRVKRLRSRTVHSNQCRAMDVTSSLWARWIHLTVSIDWHDREIVAYEFALRGRAK